MATDAHCLDRYARHGEADAFASLVERYAAMVFATCLRICGNRPDAEDASQEAFLALAKQAASVRSSLPAWLHAVATRASTRLRLRRQHARLAAVPEPEAPESPEALVDWRRFVPQLDQAVADLPDEQRELVVMRFVQGRSQVEIAALTGISQPTVSRRLGEAVRALRERLDGMEPAAISVAFEQTRAAPSPHLLSELGRMALPHPATSWPRMPRRAALKAIAATAALVAPVGYLLGRVARDDGGPPMDGQPAAAPPATTVLDRPITLTWRQGRFDRAMRCLAEYLRPADGERLELLPTRGQEEATIQVDIAADQRPLREVLDLACTQAGWRWRASGSTILVDRAAAPEGLQRVIDNFRAPPSARIANNAVYLVYLLATSGDGDRCLDVLAALADASLDALAKAQPSVADLLHCGVLHGLGALATDLLPWTATSLWHRMAGARPLAAVAAIDDGRGARGIAAAWARCRAHGLSITPFLCYLAGEFRVRAAEQDLLAIAAEPAAEVPGLDAHRPAEAAALQRIRQAAIWSLGQLGTAGAAPLILDMLRRDPIGAASASCIDALASLGDARAVPLILARPLPQDLAGQGSDYCALARLDQRALLARLPAGAPIPDGWWDAFTTHPVAGILPRMLAIGGEALNGQSRVREAFRQGCFRLGLAARPALMQRLAQPGDEVMGDWCRIMLARQGEAASLADVCRLGPGRLDALPWRLGAQGCGLALPPEDHSALARAFAPGAVAGDALAARLDWMGEVAGAGLAERLIAGFSQLSEQGRRGAYGMLAMCGCPAARALVLERLRTPERPGILLALPHTWLDPLLGLAIAKGLVELTPDDACASAERLLWCDCDAVTFISVASWAGRQKPESIEPWLLASDGHLPVLLASVAEVDLVSLVVSFMRVVEESRHPQARARALAWAADHAMRLPTVAVLAILSVMKRACGAHGDAGLHAAAEDALGRLARSVAAAGDQDVEIQRAVLGGTCDVHGLRTLSAMIQECQAAAGHGAARPPDF